MLFVLFSFLAVFVYGKQLLTGDYFRGARFEVVLHHLSVYKLDFREDVEAETVS